MVIGGSLVVGCDGQIQWWVVAVVCVCVCFFFLVVCGRNNFSDCGLFTYKVVLVDVRLCRWWLSVVVVGVVAAEVVVPLLLMMMMMGK